MEKRPITLSLEVTEFEIFYHWNYMPTIKGVGGNLGFVCPGGTLHDLSYDSLAKLGSGTHEIQFNERVQSEKGPNKGFEDERSKKMSFVKFELFCDRIHSCIAGEPFATLVMSFSPELAEEICPLLSQKHMAELSAYAREIPENISSKQAEEFEFFSSSGTTTNVPIENLKTIKKYFGENA